MRGLVVITTLLGVVISDVAGVNEKQRRASRFDHMDMNIFFNSRRLFNNYIDCLVGKRNCPPEGLDLKRQMPALMRGTCDDCTPRQRQILIKIFLRMQDDYQPQLKILLQRWDPTGQHYKRFLGYLADAYPEELKKRSILKVEEMMKTNAALTACRAMLK